MDAEKAREEADEAEALEGKGTLGRTGATNRGYRETRKFDPRKYGMVRNLPRHGQPPIPVNDRRTHAPSSMHASSAPTARLDGQLEDPPSRHGTSSARAVPASQTSAARAVAHRPEAAAGDAGRQLFEDAVEGDAKANMQLSGMVQ